MRVFVLITSTRQVQELRGIHSRFIVASLMISRSIRRDAVACLYLQDIEHAVLFHGSKIRQLRADEASAFGIINKAIKSIGKTRSPHSGVTIMKTDLKSLLRRFPRPVLVRDDRSSKNIEEIAKTLSDITYITSMQREVTQHEIDDYVSVRFPRQYSPEQEVTIINILMDHARS